MIEVSELTKSYGGGQVVSDASFTVSTGRVTAFVGPNGAGKSTTLRLILGLEKPTSGRTTIAGQPYRDMSDPLQTVGAFLTSSWLHPDRRALDHLKAMCVANGLPRTAAQNALQLVDLAGAGKKPVKKLSLGMKQRLGLATALLADPEYLILDEPLNGLDPVGIDWVRTLLRSCADKGTCVFTSSHALSEVVRTCDDIVCIQSGRIRFAGSIHDFTTHALPERYRLTTVTGAPVSMQAVALPRGTTFDPDNASLIWTTDPDAVLTAARAIDEAAELTPAPADTAEARFVKYLGTPTQIDLSGAASTEPAKGAGA